MSASSYSTASERRRRRASRDAGTHTRKLLLVIKILVALTIVTVIIVTFRTYQIQQLANQALREPTQGNLDALKHAALQFGEDLTKVFQEQRSLKEQFVDARNEIVEQNMDAAKLWSHNPVVQREYLSRARAVAATSNASTVEIDKALATIPVGTGKANAQSLRVYNAIRVGPAAAVQFGVNDAAGNPIDGLSTVDFTITDESGVVRNFAVQETEQVIEQNLVLLLDCSSSMQGLKMAEQLLAIRNFINRSSPGLRVKLIAFDSGVRDLTPFTNDKTLLLDAVQGLQANGSGMLMDAIDSAIKELAIRPGKRSLLLCTGGHEKNIDTDLERLIASSKGSQIQIHALGADEPGLNRALLTRLTAETGGTLFLASSPSKINDEFQSFMKKLSRLVYRAVILEPHRLPTSMKIALSNQPLVSASFSIE